MTIKAVKLTLRRETLVIKTLWFDITLYGGPSLLLVRASSPTQAQNVLQLKLIVSNCVSQKKTMSSSFACERRCQGFKHSYI